MKKWLNRGNFGCLMLVIATIILIIVVNRTTDNRSSSGEVINKRSAVSKYIMETYTLDNDTIYTDFDGYNFTLNQNKRYLISIHDVIIGVSGNINKIYTGEFAMYINGNCINVKMDNGIITDKLKKDIANDNIYYLLFRINKIQKEEKNLSTTYRVDATGLNFISEDYFYKKELKKERKI